MRSDDLTLGFDTSAAHCAAALLCGDELLAQCHEEMTRGQADHLMPLLDALLMQAGLRWSDLARLAVGTGPGNFTGTRISVSAARGLSLGLGVPAIGVSLFDARAQGLPRPLTVVEDARRGEVYLQQFTPDPEPPLVLDPSDAQSFEAYSVVGSAAELWAAQTGTEVLRPAYPLAEAIARAAFAQRGQPHSRPAPLYLRAADAAPPSDPAPKLLP
ncbi:MAG: tRNA (adenosine(37)-N6)-threonylcarbamoyltransferase complex dimerization subunit type 1 TsaB [Rhodobacteraceae bacterium]|nr:MAG: tRNA (adenosine(37)-N6)-threonylcarbamoyltransferase complex dimerization subunit type 1 TsaB [Paracoccaceae bacterium]